MGIQQNCLIFFASLWASAAVAGASHEILFDAPGTHPVEDALPIGNGRIGLLIPGGVAYDRIAVNEDSTWSGWVNRSANNPAAAAALPGIRKLIWQGNLSRAQEEVAGTQVPRIRDEAGRSVWDAYGSYQMLAFLDVGLEHPEGEITGYSRRLDLESATVEVRYTVGEVTFLRQFFASHADQVIAARFSADRPGALRLSATLSRPDTPARLIQADGNLLLTGEMPTPEGVQGLEYGARLLARASGGAVELENGHLRVEGADEVILLLSAGTNYKGTRAWPEKLGAGFLDRNKQQLQRASDAGWKRLLERHVADYRALYGRAHLDFAAPRPGVTTPQRLKALAGGEPDPGLMELYFNFGRYLMISSSRPGAMAANLQGLWAAAMREQKGGPYTYMTPWNGDYHSNINLQMNYWPVDVTGLDECFEPLEDLVRGMAAAGAETARFQHDARGWTLHTLHNPWGYTAPGEVASWGHFPMAGPWIVRHLWDHYAFTQDRDFLKRSWPLLEGSARFVLDWLATDPDTSLLVSGPSGSPENRFLLPGGKTGYFSMGPAMDQSIARDLFDNVLAAASELGIGNEFTDQVKSARERLAPLRIGDDGRILEWSEPWQEAEPGHRHISHLYGLHPGHEINPTTTPALVAAARKTIEHRLSHGGGHTGWSRAWIVNFYARLGDGDKAHDNLLALLKHSTLPNLFDTHPPFQIDGNFGATAGIAEMLLQSHVPAGDGSFQIELLPALPSAWPDGRVHGLRARGGFVLDFAWRDGALVEARVESLAGQPLHLRWGELEFDRPTRQGEVLEWHSDTALTDFSDNENNMQ